MSEIEDANKLLAAASNSLVRGNPFFESQVGIQMMPGVPKALMMISIKYNTDVEAMRLAMLFGAYLALRYQENITLANIYGEK